MVRVRLITKYPISYAIDREKQEVTVDGRSGFTNLTAKPNIAENKFILETESFEVKETVSFGKKIPTDGLVVEYPIFEGSGSVLHDTSGNNLHGNIYGAVWYKLPTGKYVLKFDGKDDKVVVKVQDFDTFTVIVWYRASLANQKDYSYIVAKGYSGATSGLDGWRIYLTKEYDRLTFTIGNGSDYIYAFIEPSRFDNKWHMCGMCYDGSTLLCFLDEQFYQAEKTIRNIGAGYDLTLGMGSDGGNPYNGDIGLFLFFNKDISKRKIDKIYKATAPLFGISMR